MTKTVMIVDDSRFVYEQMKAMLAGSEFEVIGYCTSGEEALEKYDELWPDIVTMDIIMPGMDGLETAEELLKSYPEARIIIVSSLAYEETEEKAAELGINFFVFKPFEEDELIDALREVAR